MCTHILMTHMCNATRAYMRTYTNTPHVCDGHNRYPSMHAHTHIYTDIPMHEHKVEKQAKDQLPKPAMDLEIWDLHTGVHDTQHMCGSHEHIPYPY